MVALVAVVLVGAGLWWRARSSDTMSATAYLTATVTKGTVADQVATTGTIEPETELALSFGGSSASGPSGGGGAGSGSGQAIAAPTAGAGASAQAVSSGATVVTSVKVRVGQQVAAGVTLATLDDTAARSQLGSAQSQLSSALARQAAETSATSATVVASDAAAVEQARQQVLTAQAALAATVLKAPTSGLVTAVNVAKGLPAASPAVTMRSQTLVVVASVPESAEPSLKAGQPAVVTFPALSRTAAGTVAGLPTAAGSGTGTAVTFPVTINVAKPPAGLLPGMSAQVSITIARRTGVETVPTAALQGSADAPSVEVLHDGTPVSVPVTVGLVTNTTSEVVTGLSIGDVVVTGVVNPNAATPPTGGGGGLRGGGLGGAGGLAGGGAGFVPPGGGGGARNGR